MTGKDKILIVGRTGQLARALIARLGERALAAGRDVCDLLDPACIEKLEAWVGGAPVSAVINAAAYTQVDKAESEREQAFRINGDAPGELARWCRSRRLPLVHFSTDYVFDGSGERAKSEDAPTAPLNVYGESKLASERAVEAAGGDALILRTAWVYDREGKNFFTTMRRLFAEKDSLSVVSDQVGAPTYAPHLAQGALDALSRAQGMQPFLSGIYHLCHGGETSWYGFASAILLYEQARNPDLRCRHISPIPSSAYPTPARRPLNSRLDCTRIRETLGVALPHWEDGLKECESGL